MPAWPRDGKNRAIKGAIGLAAWLTWEEVFKNGECMRALYWAKYKNCDEQVAWLRDVCWKGKGVDIQLKLVVRGGHRMIQDVARPPPGYIQNGHRFLARNDTPVRSNSIEDEVVRGVGDGVVDTAGLSGEEDEIVTNGTRALGGMVDLTED